MKRLFAVLFLALLSGCGIVGNMVPLTKFTVEGQNLHVAGLLNMQTLRQFEKLITDNPQIDTVVLGQIDGSIGGESLFPFAYRIRELGLGTYLPADAAVYSGGSALFLAGKTRQLERGAIIGVHSWAAGLHQAYDLPRDDPRHAPYRQYVQDMLGSDDWYWYSIKAAPADDMHIMTLDEIARYGLLTSPVITP